MNRERRNVLRRCSADVPGIVPSPHATPPEPVREVRRAYDAAYLAQHLAREFARSRRHGHFLAVLDCDIEGLLEAQERFGRPVVEGWRNEFASRAWGRIRDGDWMARSGEYSFMFVLPETDAKGARCVAERLRRLIALHPLVTPVALIDFSLGVGVTAMEAHRDPDCAMRVNALLRKADAASNRCRQLDGTRAGDSLN